MRKRKSTDVRDLLAKVNVVSQEEAEQVDVVVSMPADGPRYFTDDLIAFCVRCGVRVRHRPHAPKRPPKVCVNCALLMAKEDNGDGVIAPRKDLQA